jgi:two-component system phosphate regulon sensor histidine kinase PhoR
MWYFTTAILLASLLALHFWWRRRWGELQTGLGRHQQILMIEEQKHTQKLNEKQAQQEALFNSMTEGVLLLDRAGRIELINETLRRLFAPVSEVRGMTILEAFRLQELATVVARLHIEPQVRGVELELPGMDERWLEVSAASVLDADGVQHGAILVFHDLTRLKQLENTRQEFVANVSHELRTPLSLIKGFVETLLEGAKDEPELATRFLKTIEKHTDRLTFLIEDLLTISRLESGQIVLNFQDVNLAEEVQRVVDDLQSRVGEKKTSFQILVPASLTARADADRLQQVLFNLIENAIKYGKHDGHVTVGGQPAGKDKVELWVQDDGPGIPAEARERIFERFYRVDRARSRETGGTGLGLAIVKHIVQAHGGEVWVKSEVGAGATFYFALPSGDGLAKTNVQ